MKCEKRKWKILGMKLSMNKLSCSCRSEFAVVVNFFPHDLILKVLGKSVGG